MITDHLNRWEKAALFTTGAGGAYNILLYQLGYSLADAVPGHAWLFGSRVLFALISFVGFDLTLVVTVRAMREGRRSVWAWATVGLAALAAAGIALDVSHVLPAPVLHAAPVLVLAAFMLHLAAPKAAHRRAPAHARSARRAWRLRREVRAGAALLRTVRAELAEARAEADTARALAAQEAGRAARSQEAARAAEEQAAQATGLDARTVALWLAQEGVSGREIARRLGMGESTVRSWLKAPAQRASAAD